MQALVGTAKGLIVYNIQDGYDPRIDTIHFIGFNVSVIYVDERSNRWWACISHKHWGQKLHFSDNDGKSWQEASLPSYRGEFMPDGSIAKLRQIWCIQHGGLNRPGHLWMGTDPGGLFLSRDNGQSFKLVKSLWHHPSRMKEGQWFGAGSDYPFIHSIVVDSNDNDHVYIAVSCAGVFETRDSGKTWSPRNNGLKADYLPIKNVEVGHDPHHLLSFKSNAAILWQQNHCGIYYSLNGGGKWIDVSSKSHIPYYGFSIAIDDKEPGKAWVIPVESDERRVAPDLQLQVMQTIDFGKTWTAVNEGLPQEPTFDIALRQAFVKKEDIFLFGTTNGNLYYSSGQEIRWKNISNHLTKINAVFLY